MVVLKWLESVNLKNISEKIKLVLQFFLFLLLLLMVITVFANVISRYFFSTSLNWVDELSRAAFVWSAFIGIVIVMWEKGHIGLGNVLNNINPTLGRIASLIGVILQIIFTIYLFMGGMRLFLLTIVQLTPYLAIPCGYIYSIAPVMTVFMFALTIRNLIFILKNKQGDIN